MASGQKVAVYRCTVTNASAVFAGGPGGGDGIQVGARSLVVDSIVTDNGGDGIQAGTSSVVRGNVVSQNGGYGINLTSDTLVIGNAVSNSPAGNLAACATCTFVDNEAP